MDWVGSGDSPFGSVAFKSPCRIRIPSLMVGRRILEVTILYQFGIKSAICSITDILEEHAHKIGGDTLMIVPIYGESGFYIIL